MRADEIGPWLLERQREVLFQEAVLAFMGVDWPPNEAHAAGTARWPEQGIGSACRGAHVEGCLQTFGNGLGLACSTCGTSYERTGRL